MATLLTGRRSIVRLSLTAVLYFAWIFFIHQTLFTSRRFSVVQLTDANGEAVYTIDGVNTARTSEETKALVSKASTGPTLVAIHSYQRCGSSFFGDMFNNNPNVFYQFEPLDALYSHLYGTDYSWNVPSDIYYYENGTRRPIAEVDTDRVVKHLRDLLQCNTESLPTATLIHHFLHAMPEQFNQIAPYIQCMNDATRKYYCHRENIFTFCGKRYGAANETRRATCRILLNNPHDTKTPEVVSDKVRRDFREYDHCLHDVRQIVEASCMDKLKPVCNAKPIRATKLVRANMKIMEKLLESESESFVIHLLRDPRGVAMSRASLHDAVKGHYSIEAKQNESETIVREALMYCTLALDDAIAVRELEKKYSGRILTVIYEDFVKNVTKNIHRVYDFIGQPLNETTFNLIYAQISAQSSRRKKEINEVTTARPFIVNRFPHSIFRRLKSVQEVEPVYFRKTTVAPSEDIATKWQEKLSKDVNDRIVSACKDFYDEVDFDWKLL